MAYFIIETVVHFLTKSGKSLKDFIQGQEIIRYKFSIGMER